MRGKFTANQTAAYPAKLLRTMIDASSLTDRELLWLMSQDDPRAFQHIYERYWDQLFFQALRRLKNTAAAEEIVQDVFLTLWQKRKTLVIDSLPRYLSAMSRYAVYRQLASALPTVPGSILQQLETERPAAPETFAENKLMLDMVRNISNHLPEKCRKVFVYNKIEDQSLPEVARRLNISLKTAEAHLTKALRIIRMNIRF